MAGHARQVFSELSYAGRRNLHSRLRACLGVSRIGDPCTALHAASWSCLR